VEFTGIGGRKRNSRAVAVKSYIVRKLLLSSLSSSLHVIFVVVRAVYICVCVCVQWEEGRCWNVSRAVTTTRLDPIVSVTSRISDLWWLHAHSLFLRMQFPWDYDAVAADRLRWSRTICKRPKRMSSLSTDELRFRQRSIERLRRRVTIQRDLT